MAGHVAHHDPGRVLAEVAALRRLLEQLNVVERIVEAREVWSVDVDELRRTLATIWADHTSYDPAWAPEEAVRPIVEAGSGPGG
jgi:hypothetical protein